MPSLEIKIENLVTHNDFIADLDVAKETTEQTKNNVLVQAATSLLAQAKDINQMALSLLS